MILWPKDNPQYIIACNEQGPPQPALQRISLATGDATTIVATWAQLLRPGPGDAVGHRPLR